MVWTDRLDRQILLLVWTFEWKGLSNEMKYWSEGNVVLFFCHSTRIRNECSQYGTNEFWHFLKNTCHLPLLSVNSFHPTVEHLVTTMSYVVMHKLCLRWQDTCSDFIRGNYSCIEHWRNIVKEETVKVHNTEVRGNRKWTQHVTTHSHYCPAHSSLFRGPAYSSSCRYIQHNNGHINFCSRILFTLRPSNLLTFHFNFVEYSFICPKPLTLLS